MRRIVLVLALGTAAAAPAIATGAAQAASGGSCDVKATVHITPGVSLKPSTGQISLSGGTIACFGFINNKPVVGKGTLSGGGNYGTGRTRALQHGDTCGQGSGSGWLAATLPKAGGGSITVSGTFSFVRVGPAVEVDGKMGTAHFGGTMAFGPPPSQNCVKTRVTSATVAGTVALGG